jgi:hypothetical protein
LAKIGNSKWLPGGCLSMKPDVHVSIGHCIIENENKGEKSPQKLQKKLSYWFLHVISGTNKKLGNF